MKRKAQGAPAGLAGGRRCGSIALHRRLHQLVHAPPGAAHPALVPRPRRDPAPSLRPPPRGPATCCTSTCPSARSSAPTAPSTGSAWKRAWRPATSRALRAEMRAYARLGYRFDAAYVGGGTPTVLPAELGSVLRLARELWPIRSLSVETNPNHLTPEILGLLADCGVDRLSVGVQSFDDGLLASVHRLHRYGSGAEIRDRLAAARGTIPHPERGHDLQPGRTEPGHAGARPGGAPGAGAGAGHLLPADEPARPAGLVFPRAPLLLPDPRGPGRGLPALHRLVLLAGREGGADRRVHRRPGRVRRPGLRLVRLPRAASCIPTPSRSRTTSGARAAASCRSRRPAPSRPARGCATISS